MAKDTERSWLTGEGDSPWQASQDRGAFPPTCWTLVINAARDDSVAIEALEELCRSYWYPLYAFVRRQGKSAHDAQDLTQGFFEYLLGGGYLARADRDKGRLRSYLLGALKHFSAYQYRKATAQKRGGGAPPISIDEELAEERFHNEPRADESETPDRLFERRWALTVLETVLAALQAEYRAAGKQELFATLAGFLAWNSGESTYSEAGAKIGMKEGAVKVAVHRMRKRFREILCEEIRATVESPEEVEGEIDYLLSVLS